MEKDLVNSRSSDTTEGNGMEETVMAQLCQKFMVHGCLIAVKILSDSGVGNNDDLIEANNWVRHQHEYGHRWSSQL